MVFPEDDDMVEKLSANTADEAFGRFVVRRDRHRERRCGRYRASDSARSWGGSLNLGSGCDYP